MKAVLSIALLAILSLATSANAAQEDAIDHSVNFTFAVLKGYITGYYKGMYKKTNYNLDTECFGEQMASDALKLLGDAETSTVDWVQDLVTLQQLSLYFVKYCDFDDALYDITKYCTDFEKRCEVIQMSQVLLKKMFQVTTVANHAAEMMMSGLPESTDYTAVFEFTEGIGSDFGKLIRYATDFEGGQI